MLLRSARRLESIAAMFLGAAFDDSFDDRALGPRNVVESKLGSNPSHIGVRFTTWLTSLKLSASMSRSIPNRSRNIDTVHPCSAGWVHFSLSSRFGY